MDVTSNATTAFNGAPDAHFVHPRACRSRCYHHRVFSRQKRRLGWLCTDPPFLRALRTVAVAIERDVALSVVLLQGCRAFVEVTISMDRSGVSMCRLCEDIHYGEHALAHCPQEVAPRKAACTTSPQNEAPFPCAAPFPRTSQCTSKPHSLSTRLGPHQDQSLVRLPLLALANFRACGSLPGISCACSHSTAVPAAQTIPRWVPCVYA